jgi:hypothetical protein
MRCFSTDRRRRRGPKSVIISAANAEGTTWGPRFESGLLQLNIGAVAQLGRAMFPHRLSPLIERN